MQEELQVNYCECCGRSKCICPVCPTCKERGNPRCYMGVHGLTYNHQQLLGQARQRIATLKLMLDEAALYYEQLRQGGIYRVVEEDQTEEEASGEDKEIT